MNKRERTKSLSKHYLVKNNVSHDVCREIEDIVEPAIEEVKNVQVT